MGRVISRRWFRLLVILATIFLLGNVAAPYYACEGRQEGDRCSWGYSCSASPNGRCRITGEFKDDPATTGLNESLVCDTSAR